MIFLPKRELIVPMHLKTGIRGMYKIEAVNVTDGRRRVLADWFPNLITTNGGNLLGSGGNALTYCSVGTGNTPPALTDVQLVSLVATTSTLNSFTRGNSGSSPYYGTTNVQFNFAAGTATGNLSEVGVGSASNGTSLFSRALILDGGGNPTTITVLNTEALYVTYQLNQYVPLVDGSGSFVINGTTYNYTVRGANATSNAWAYQTGDSAGLSSVTAYNGSIGTITGSPSGTSSGESSHVNNAYSTGSFQNTGVSTFGLTQGNLAGGISALLANFGASFSSRGQFQFGLTPAIAKDSSHNLTLNFTASWVINSP
jgi:hypothetical protein